MCVQLGKIKPMKADLSKSDLNLMLDIIHSSLSCKSITEYKKLIEMAKTLLCFTHIRSVFGDANEYAQKKMNALKMITHFPKEWEMRYNDKDYFLSDNIALTAFQKNGLIFWADHIRLKEVDDRRNKECEKIMQEAASVGLKQGWLYSIHGKKSSACAILSISGENCEKCERSKKILDYLAPHLCQATKRIVRDQNETNAQLSPRECEVLSWTAAGKTAWETSVILNISRRTVEFHMGNILKKLDAVNSQHAIAIALSSGMIQY